METFIASTDSGLKTQLETFCSNIDSYSSSLSLNAGKIEQIKKGSTYYSFVFNKNVIYHDYAKSLTEHKDIVIGNGTEVLTPFPPLPALGTVPDQPDNPDVAGLLAEIIQDAKRSRNFNTDAARALGVLKVPGSFNPDEGTPTFKVSTGRENHPKLVWVKGEYQGVEIWKDSGDGAGWKKHDKVFSPEYIDTTTLPASGVSKVWKYKMIYIYKDVVVGLWSEEQSITVTGTV